MYDKVKTVAILIVVIIVSIVYTNNSQSQETASQAKGGAGLGYSMLGKSVINLKDLNAIFESKGYSKISDNFFSVGGGGHGIIKDRWIIGGEGHSLLGNEVTSGNYKSSIYVSYGFFNLGYIFYSVKDVRVYPILGIGGGGMNLKIGEKVTSLSFGDILDNPMRNVELSTGGFLLNLAFGVDYLLKFSEDKKGKAGLVLGLRAGYTLSPFKGGWTMDEIEISGMPEIGITGPYIRFMIGGGGFSK